MKQGKKKLPFNKEKMNKMSATGGLRDMPVSDKPFKKKKSMFGNFGK